MYAQKNHLDNKESSNGAPGTNVHNSSNVTPLQHCTSFKLFGSRLVPIFSGPDLGPNILQTIISRPHDNSRVTGFKPTEWF